MTVHVRSLVAMAAIALASCGSIPEGTFGCTRDADCPQFWYCRSDGHCWSSPDGVGLDASIDSGGFDSGGFDSGGFDSGSVDSGSVDSGLPPGCPKTCDDGNECSDDSCGPETGFVCSNQANDEVCMLSTDPCNHYQCFDFDCSAYLGPVVDDLIIDATRRCCAGSITNVNSNISHCGMCNRQCTGGSPTCFGGNCQ